MNKLGEYREKLWIDFISSEESFGVEHDEAFEKGFNSVVALDLPVKFAEWKDSKEQSWKEWARNAVLEDRYSMKAAYQYWIENILKIE